MVADIFDVPLPSSARLVLALRDMAAVEPAAAGALALALHEATAQANALRAVEASWASGHASAAQVDGKAAAIADRAADQHIKAIYTICDGAHKAYGAAPRGQLARRALAELFPRGLRGATQVPFPEQEVQNEELIAALRHPDWAELVSALELGPIIDALVDAQATFVAALHPADEDGADYEAVRAARRAAHRALHALVGCVSWTLRTDEDRTAAILAPLRATIAAERGARARRTSGAGGASGPTGAAS
jgi:hypothetical protein